MVNGAPRGRITAVLGPTNTGKTHLALERMSGYATGMIGFPLRLLARENYDRLVRIKGKGAVALLTGEEKIIPPRPTHFVCTVESMPLDRVVDFLAIDEIQLCADPDRGHAFTDRLLHARGRVETMFLGAETIKPLLRRLLPEAEFVSRPRFSKLTYSGPRKIARLPPRSAVVAFSAAEVYAIAEMVRRVRGGAAVVLGALSPRTRNAQVGLYQAGEVDYLIATDAIGMGLNMDVDHVAFAASRKFDGRVPRDLEATEVAQIAGRAGRHMNDGTFGTTADIAGLAPDIVEAVETHNFQPLKLLQWRNSDLRFTSLDALLSSLSRLPDRPGLVRARDADDQLVLANLAKDDDIRQEAKGPEAVRLLWDACQIPDFGKTSPDQHARLVRSVYRHLTGPEGRLPNDWLDAQVRRIDRIDGDIETLIGRIANIRTWTYVSHRADWVDDALSWRERTRSIEDRLSDALHERLTQRFVDRRTAHLVRRIKDGERMASSVGDDGTVSVEGHFLGHLDGFRFRPDQTEGMQAARAVMTAASRSLEFEITGRVRELCADPDDAFRLDPDGIVRWKDGAVARLTPGSEPLHPMLEILTSDLLDAGSRDAIRQRMAQWLAAMLEKTLSPLFAATRAKLSGAARGIVWQLGQALGCVPTNQVQAQIKALTTQDRHILAQLGIRLGTESLFFPKLLKPGLRPLCALLWATAGEVGTPALPPPDRIAFVPPAEMPPSFLAAIGFRMVGPAALRVDALERFAFRLRKLAHADGFVLPPDLLSSLGLKADIAEAVIQALGYRASNTEEGPPHWHRAKHPKGPARNRPKRKPASDGNQSPFAVLRRLA